MSAMRRSADDFDLPLEVLDGDDLGRYFPAHVVDAGEFGLFDPRGGYLYPELAVIAAVSSRLLGATARTHTRVEAIDASPTGANVRTGAGVERFDHVVVTTGPWARTLIPAVAGLVELRRPIQAWFAATSRLAIDPETFPVFSRYGATPCYGLPGLDGLGIKLGLTSTDNRPVNDPDSVNRTVTVEEVQTFRERLALVLRGLHPDPYRVSAYVEAYTPDGHALVGPLPVSDRVSIMVGFSGSGFKFAAAMGEVGADLALRGTSGLMPAAMRLDRFPGR